MTSGSVPEGKIYALIQTLPVNLPALRFCHYDDPDPLSFYLKNLGHSQQLGAVGMHENLGGLTVAIIPNARPEDSRGGGANVLVLYPKNEQEAIKITAANQHRQPAQRENNQRIRRPRMKSLNRMKSPI